LSYTKDKYCKKISGIRISYILIQKYFRLIFVPCNKYSIRINNTVMQDEENEKKRLMPYVFIIIIIGSILIIMLVDWLFSLF